MKIKLQKRAFYLLHIFLKDPVLLIAALCAVLSCFITPQTNILQHINWEVLGTLFCLMLVVAGLHKCRLFELLAQKLLLRCHSLRILRLILVLLPFFTSMFITNDVALIAFVPFAISVLKMAGYPEQLIRVTVLQTIAANLGSMALPVGNPQSLFLYHYYHFSLSQYCFALLPFVLSALPALSIASLVGKNHQVKICFSHSCKLRNQRELIVFVLLFALCMISVLHLLDYRLLLAVVVVSFAFMDRHLLCHIDYGLLLTFICFFIFSGNLAQMPAAHLLLDRLMLENTMLTSLAVSQIISNVPAAIMLSGFTTNATGLLIGTNIGGLGTIIASLASLISFKYYLRSFPTRAMPYLIHFTLANLLAMLLMLIIFQTAF